MNLYDICKEVYLASRRKKVLLVKQVEASDILAELDCAVVATKKAFPIAINEREAVFLGDAYQALTGFRAHIRSEQFRRKIECNRKGANP